MENKMGVWVNIGKNMPFWGEKSNNGDKMNGSWAEEAAIEVSLELDRLADPWNANVVNDQTKRMTIIIFAEFKKSPNWSIWKTNTNKIFVD